MLGISMGRTVILVRLALVFVCCTGLPLLWGLFFYVRLWLHNRVERSIPIVRCLFQLLASSTSRAACSLNQSKQVDKSIES